MLNDLLDDLPGDVNGFDGLWMFFWRFLKVLIVVLNGLSSKQVAFWDEANFPTVMSTLKPLTGYPGFKALPCCFKR